MYVVRSITDEDRSFVKKALTNLWGSDQMVYSGVIFDAGNLLGFLAVEGERVVGLVTYEIRGTVCQIITINALTPGKGIGTVLIEKVKEVAKENACKELTVVTTNDNLKALKFYQKKGFVLKALYVNAIEKSRKIKPQIPLIGEDGIPLRDEIELQMFL